MVYYKNKNNNTNTNTIYQKKYPNHQKYKLYTKKFSGGEVLNSALTKKSLPLQKYNISKGGYIKEVNKNINNTQPKAYKNVKKCVKYVKPKHNNAENVLEGGNFDLGKKLDVASQDTFAVTNALDYKVLRFKIKFQKIGADKFQKRLLNVHKYLARVNLDYIKLFSVMTKLVGEGEMDKDKKQRVAKIQQMINDIVELEKYLHSSGAYVPVALSDFDGSKVLKEMAGKYTGGKSKMSRFFKGDKYNSKRLNQPLIIYYVTKLQDTIRKKIQKLSLFNNTGDLGTACGEGYKTAKILGEIGTVGIGKIIGDPLYDTRNALLCPLGKFRKREAKFNKHYIKFTIHYKKFLKLIQCEAKDKFNLETIDIYSTSTKELNISAMTDPALCNQANLVKKFDKHAGFKNSQMAQRFKKTKLYKDTQKRNPDKLAKYEAKVKTATANFSTIFNEMKTSLKFIKENMRNLESTYCVRLYQYNLPGKKGLWKSLVGTSTKQIFIKQKTIDRLVKEPMFIDNFEKLIRGLDAESKSLTTPETQVAVTQALKTVLEPKDKQFIDDKGERLKVIPNVLLNDNIEKKDLNVININFVDNTIDFEIINIITDTTHIICAQNCSQGMLKQFKITITGTEITFIPIAFSGYSKNENGENTKFNIIFIKEDIINTLSYKKENGIDQTDYFQLDIAKGMDPTYSRSFAAVNIFFMSDTGDTGVSSDDKTELKKQNEEERKEEKEAINNERVKKIVGTSDFDTAYKEWSAIVNTEKKQTNASVVIKKITIDDITTDNQDKIIALLAQSNDKDNDIEFIVDIFINGFDDWTEENAEVIVAILNISSIKTTLINDIVARFITGGETLTWNSNNIEAIKEIINAENDTNFKQHIKTVCDEINKIVNDFLGRTNILENYAAKKAAEEANNKAIDKANKAQATKDKATAVHLLGEALNLTLTAKTATETAEAINVYIIQAQADADAAKVAAGEAGNQYDQAKQAYTNANNQLGSSTVQKVKEAIKRAQEAAEAALKANDLAIKKKKLAEDAAQYATDETKVKEAEQFAKEAKTFAEETKANAQIVKQKTEEVLKAIAAADAAAAAVPGTSSKGKVLLSTQRKTLGQKGTNQKGITQKEPHEVSQMHLLKASIAAATTNPATTATTADDPGVGVGDIPEYGGGARPDKFPPTCLRIVSTELISLNDVAPISSTSSTFLSKTPTPPQHFDIEMIKSANTYKNESGSNSLRTAQYEKIKTLVKDYTGVEPDIIAGNFGGSIYKTKKDDDKITSIDFSENSKIIDAVYALVLLYIYVYFYNKKEKSSDSSYENLMNTYLLSLKKYDYIVKTFRNFNHTKKMDFTKFKNYIITKNENDNLIKYIIDTDITPYFSYVSSKNSQIINLFKDEYIEEYKKVKNVKTEPNNIETEIVIDAKQNLTIKSLSYGLVKSLLGSKKLYDFANYNINNNKELIIKLLSNQNTTPILITNLLNNNENDTTVYNYLLLFKDQTNIDPIKTKFFKEQDAILNEKYFNYLKSRLENPSDDNLHYLLKFLSIENDFTDYTHQILYELPTITGTATDDPNLNRAINTMNSKPLTTAILTKSSTALTSKNIKIPNTPNNSYIYSDPFTPSDITLEGYNDDKQPIYRRSFEKDNTPPNYKFTYEPKLTLYTKTNLQALMLLLDKYQSVFTLGYKPYLKRDLGCFSLLDEKDEKDGFGVRKLDNLDTLYTLNNPGFIESYLNKFSGFFNASGKDEAKFYSENQILRGLSQSQPSFNTSTTLFYNIDNKDNKIYDKIFSSIDKKTQQQCVKDVIMRMLLIPSEDLKEITGVQNIRNTENPKQSLNSTVKGDPTSSSSTQQTGDSLRKSYYNPIHYVQLAQTFTLKFYRDKALPKLLHRLNKIVNFEHDNPAVSGEAKRIAMPGNFIEVLLKRNQQGNYINLGNRALVANFYEFIFIMLKIKFIDHQIKNLSSLQPEDVIMAEIRADIIKRSESTAGGSLQNSRRFLTFNSSQKHITHKQQFKAKKQISSQLRLKTKKKNRKTKTKQDKQKSKSQSKNIKHKRTKHTLKL